MRWTKKLLGGAMAAVMLLNITACSGEPSSGGEESGVSGNMSDEERIIAAAEAGKVGNWGLGNEYEIQALLPIMSAWISQWISLIRMQLHWRLQ